MIISLIVLLFHFQCFKAFSWFNPFYLKNKYYNTINWDTQNDLLVWQEPLSLKEFIAPSLLLPAIERIHTSYQTIDIATDLTDKTKKHFTLYLDGHYQFNTQNERSYHETMAYTPMLLFKHVPNKILILGGGDGLLARDLLKNNQAQITIVEIDPQVTALAALKKHTLSTFNDNALNSNRVTLVHDDAFTWLRSNKEKFDAIYMDFPLPFTYDGIRLYSADFFKMVKNRLNMQGYIVIDVLIKSIRQKNMIFETLYYAGYKTLFGFKNTTDSFITGTIEKKVLNRKHFQLPFHMSSSQEEFEDDFNFFTVPQPKIFSQVNDLLKPQDFEVF